MKAHLFALLASLALVKAVPAPAEIQLQVTVHDEDHNSVRVLLSDDEVTKLELVYECAYRAHWGKPCYLKSARNGRWLGKCAVSADFFSFCPFSHPHSLLKIL